MNNVSKGGKQYLVYMDAEFQAYRVPDDDDPFIKDGYIKTPHWTSSRNDLVNSNYHFLLSLGLIIYDAHDRRTMKLALFPSKAIGHIDTRFTNAQLLEPGYTTVRPATAARILELKNNLVLHDPKYGTRDHKFPWRSSMDSTGQALLDEGHAAYNSGLRMADRAHGKAVLRDFLEHIVPNAKIVHKGQNDLYALMNSARLMEFGVPPIDSRDLDLYLPVFRSLHLPGALALLKERLVEKNTTGVLAPLETEFKAAVEEFVVDMFGEGARASVGAHNPLVDCAYAQIVDIICATVCDGNNAPAVCDRL
jgi:hypothetical protein